MTSVEIANPGDVESLVELEALLFAEDAGVHDPHADVTWPLREGRANFRRLLADDNSVVLVARRNGTVVGHVAGYAASSSPTRQPVTFGVLRSMYVRSNARERASDSYSPRRSSSGHATRAASRCMSTATSKMQPPDACMNNRDSLREASLTSSGSDHLDPQPQGTRYRPLGITALTGQQPPHAGPSRALRFPSKGDRTQRALQRRSRMRR